MGFEPMSVLLMLVFIPSNHCPKLLMINKLIDLAPVSFDTSSFNVVNSSASRNNLFMESRFAKPKLCNSVDIVFETVNQVNSNVCPRYLVGPLFVYMRTWNFLRSRPFELFLQERATVGAILSGPVTKMPLVLCWDPTNVPVFLFL